MRGATRSAVRFLFRAAQSTAGRTGEVGTSPVGAEEDVALKESRGETPPSSNATSSSAPTEYGCALFYKPIWQLTVNERGHYADSEDTFLFKIEDSPDTRLGA